MIVGVLFVALGVAGVAALYAVEQVLVARTERDVARAAQQQAEAVSAEERAQREAAVAYVRDVQARLDLMRVQLVPEGVLRVLEREAAGYRRMEEVAARYRKALERIADQHTQPARVAREVLEQERRRAWALN